MNRCTSIKRVLKDKMKNLCEISTDRSCIFFRTATNRLEGEVSLTMKDYPTARPTIMPSGAPCVPAVRSPSPAGVSLPWARSSTLNISCVPSA